MATINAKQFFSGGKVTVEGNHSDQLAQQNGGQKQPGILDRAATGIKHFGQNLAGDFMNRGQNVVNSFDDALHNKQSGFSAGYQTVGQVAGAAGDIIGRAAQPITDHTIKPLVQKAVGTSTVHNAISQYAEWARQHPEASRNLESTVNITNLLGLGEAEGVAKSAAGDAADVVKNGVKSVAKTGIETAANAADTVKSSVNPVATFGSKMLVGEDLHAALAHFAENTDNVNAFRTGTKTYQSIADNIVKAHDTFDTASFKEFQNMKKGLPEIKVPNSNVVGEVKKIISDTPNLLPKEQQTVQNAIDLVRNNKDQSLKGILDLRNRIDRSGFIRNGDEFVNSNRVITKIRSKLNDMAIERAKNYDLANGTNYSQQITQGLKKASSNIDLLDRIKSNFFGNGKNVETTASKIRQIIGKIDDPTEYEATKNLLKEIEGRTKVNLVNDLESAKTAQIINKTTKLKGGFSHPLNSASELLNKSAVKGVETFQKMKKPR